jgi:7-cyano-7-deazaguanine synthase
MENGQDQRRPSRPGRAVVLLSGGLDSTTVLAVARSEGYEAHALSFRYGQRHAIELCAAERVAARFGVEHHRVIDIDLRAFGGSALTSDLPVPKNRDLSEAPESGGIPSTYVPARNTIFLSFALAYAEIIGAPDIFLGVNALDYSGYPDCRPEYLTAFERMANLATRAGVEGAVSFRVHAPLLRLTKREIVQLGVSLGVDYSLTTSCYDPAPDGAACGECDSCQLRLRGFAEAGISDPISYARSASKATA